MSAECVGRQSWLVQSEPVLCRQAHGTQSVPKAPLSRSVERRNSDHFFPRVRSLFRGMCSNVPYWPKADISFHTSSVRFWRPNPPSPRPPPPPPLHPPPPTP